MNYYDEARPRINYRPAYVDSKGRAIAPLPSLTVLQLLDGSYRVGVWLRVSFNSAQQYYCEVSILDRLGELLLDFKEEPEKALAEYFGYTGMAGTSDNLAEPVTPMITLSDLGL